MTEFERPDGVAPGPRSETSIRKPFWEAKLLGSVVKEVDGEQVQLYYFEGHRLGGQGEHITGLTGPETVCTVRDPKPVEVFYAKHIISKPIPIGRPHSPEIPSRPLRVA